MQCYISQLHLLLSEHAIEILFPFPAQNHILRKIYNARERPLFISCKTNCNHVCTLDQSDYGPFYYHS